MRMKREEVRLLIFSSFTCFLACSFQSPPLSVCSGRKTRTSIFHSLDPTVSNREDTSKSQAAKPRWITCSSSNEMAATVSHLVKPGDTVAELGAQLRNVSSCICASLEGSGRAVLVDITRKFPKNTQQEHRTRAMRRPGEETGFHPNVATFVEISGLDDWRRAFLDHQPKNAYNMFVLDVNAIVGNDLEWTSLSIIREFTALFDRCRVVVVKSVALNQWATRLVHGQRWIAKNAIHRDIPPPHIVATVGVQEYRRTISTTVKPGDSCLEVGCHLGTSTILLNEAAGQENVRGFCIGVDVGPRIIQGAKERHPGVYFATGDAWKTASLLRIQREYFKTVGNTASSRIGFDVVYVDVGGLSGSDGLMEALSLLSALINALEPRCIVIKSLCMRRLASALFPSWRIE